MANSFTGHPVVTKALAKMAMLRQAETSALTLNLYSAELAERGIAVEVVVRACAALQETPRREGETAFPDLGTLLKACSVAKEAIRQERNAALAASCPKLLRPGEDQPPMSRADARAFVAQLRRDVEAVRGGR